jgi:hypothetical protein
MLQGDGWLSLGRCVAKLVAHLLDTAALWVRRHLSKYDMGDIIKEVANTLEPAKKIYKKMFFRSDTISNLYLSYV